MPDMLRLSPIEELAKAAATKRAIQYVEANLESICHARNAGHTWDAIAQAMGICRPTIINAVKTLLARQPGQSGQSGVFSRARVNTNTVNVDFIPVPPVERDVTAAINVLPTQEGKQAYAQSSASRSGILTTPAPKTDLIGIVPLGRARPDQFNF